MTTFPLPTLAPTVTATGITAPSYADLVSSVNASFQSIFGSDIYIAPDSQDCQQIAIFMSAQNDTNNTLIVIYYSFSPAKAQGVALSSNVKLNGLQRQVATNSQADATIIAAAGTQIINGLIGDDQSLNTRWTLPALVTVPISGTIDVTVTCTAPGATIAAPGTLTQILTPTRGWQSVTNAASATPGNPIETDADLRRRQALSTSQPSETPFDAILGAVLNLPGVSRADGYDNATGSTDSNGVPAHSIVLIVEGGDLTQIAQTILNKKAPGVPTYGSTSETVTDKYGRAVSISFYQLALVQIYVSLTIHALPGFISSTVDDITSALVTYLSTLNIGEDVYYNRLWSPANLAGSSATTATGKVQSDLDAASATYDITALTVGTAPSPTGTTDITIPFNEAAVALSTNVLITVT